MTRSPCVPIWFGIAFCCATVAHAQVVVTPFVSANVRATPGFIDLDDASKDLHAGFGVTVSRLTDGWIGLEGETTVIPSAFSGRDLVRSSRLLTASGSVLVTPPTRWKRVVRPYLSIGAGIAHIDSADVARLFVIDSSQPVVTASVGAWTWFGPRIGIRTSLRFVRTLRIVESDSLETWQPSIGVSWRF